MTTPINPAAKHPLRNFPFLREDDSRLVLRPVEAERVDSSSLGDALRPALLPFGSSLASQSRRYRAAIAIAALALTACEPPTQPQPSSGYLEVITDGSTGCKYLTPRTAIGAAALTPKLRADGKPDCPKALS